MVGITNSNDYSPFGVQLDGRTISRDSYRYGYQGSEKDDEAKGSGNSYTTFFRQLDPRVGRWFSIDPKMSAWESPYVSMGNNPTKNSDPYGDTINIKGDNGETHKYVPGEKYDGSDKFIEQSVNALNQTYNGGNSGKKLIENLNSIKNEVLINNSTKNYAKGYEIYWNPNGTNGGIDEKGTIKRPVFLGLAHELAHAEDYDQNKTNYLLGVDMYADWSENGVVVGSEAEKYATHIENKIRFENKIPLRTHYGLEENQSGGISGFGKIIKEGKSLFFKTDVTFFFIKNEEVVNKYHGKREFNYRTDFMENIEYNIPQEIFDAFKIFN
ncbi:MAG: hypothetical protein FGM14_16185 [Flavobacteriales bacterium]|nr:hypothetical protein [Flavobacteriales bacterium]